MADVGRERFGDFGDDFGVTFVDFAFVTTVFVGSAFVACFAFVSIFFVDFVDFVERDLTVLAFTEITCGGGEGGGELGTCTTGTIADGDLSHCVDFVFVMVE